MPECSVRSACCNVLWLSLFAMSIVISVIPLYNNVPARCSNISESNPQQFLGEPGRNTSNVRCGPPFRTFQVQVKGQRETAYFCFGNNRDQCEGAEDYFDDGNDEINDNNQTERDCWRDRSIDERYFCFSTNEDFRRIEMRASFLDRVASATMLLSIAFGLLTIASFASIFKPEFFRCCPSWLLTSSWVTRYRPEPVPSQQLGQGGEANRQSRPSVVALQRRINQLVETTKLSEEQVQALHDEGWSCCVCLEERRGEDEQLAQVSRLQCNHATHSECLRSWLEKGRAVCPLCNTDVFPQDSKADTSTRSSGSGYDGGPAGSLEVERTEGAPSSPGNSIFIDLAQSRPAGPAQSNDPEEQA